MSENRVVYNGMEMAAEWPERIKAAQQVREYLICGTAYARIRYGDEKGGPFSEPCHDCGVLPGQLHVELVCDMEQCPRCGGQVIGCDCTYEGDGPDDVSDLPPHQNRTGAPVDIESLLAKVRGETNGYTLFLETKDRSFVAVESATEIQDPVALVATWIQNGVPPWETEEPAKQLTHRLLERCGVRALVLLSRDPNSFVGYYVRITG